MKTLKLSSIFLIILLSSNSILSQSPENEFSNQFKSSIRPARGIQIGNNLKKAGLVTAIIGSGFLTFAVFYAANTHDEWVGVLVPGAIGITFLSVSIPLTISGFVVKYKHKKRLNEN